MFFPCPPPMLLSHTLHWLSISSWHGDHSGPCYPKSTGETTKLQKTKPLCHLTCPMNGWGLPLPAYTDLNKYLLKELDSPSVINQCIMSLENSLIKSLFQVTQMKVCGFVCWHTYEHHALEVLRCSRNSTGSGESLPIADTMALHASRFWTFISNTWSC